MFSFLKKWFARFFSKPGHRQNLKERQVLKDTLKQVEAFPKISLLLMKVLENKVDIEDYIAKNKQSDLQAYALEAQVDEICEIAATDSLKLASIEKKLTSFEARKCESELPRLAKKKLSESLSDLELREFSSLQESQNYFEKIRKTKEALLPELELSVSTLENLKLQIDDLLGTDGSLEKPLSQLTLDLNQKVRQTRELQEKMEGFLNTQ